MVIEEGYSNILDCHSAASDDHEAGVLIITVSRFLNVINTKTRQLKKGRAIL